MLMCAEWALLLGHRSPVACTLQGLENSAPMDAGSIFCDEQRQLLGRVEDIFGLVTQPSYAVRPCGATPLDTPPQPGTRVLAVVSLSSNVDLGGVAHAAPGIDFEEGVEDKEDIDDDDLDGEGQRKAGPGYAGPGASGSGKSSRGRSNWGASNSEG